MINADTSAAREIAVSPDESRAQLSRILKSPDFEATSREHRFLEHVVEEAVCGRGDRIKAYSIAVEVFGRDANFDPQNDPIVRIEAGHLRRSLERYYLTGGKEDPVVITIPKGAYVPSFSRRLISPSPGSESAEAPGGGTWLPKGGNASWLTVVLAAVVAGIGVLAIQLGTVGAGPTKPEVPRLVVEPFDDLAGTESSGAIARGLTQEIIVELAKFKDIVVFGATDNGLKAAAQPRFALAGSVNLDDDSFRLSVRLISTGDGSVLWANSYDGGMKVAAVLAAQADIARNVATALAQTYGVIYQADATNASANPPDDWAAYACTLSYYSYRASLDRTALPTVRACLQEAVHRFPNYATAWGLLAQAYIDEVRYTFPYDPLTAPVAIAKALDTARRAVELDPLNIRSLQAEMVALFFSGEFDAARNVGERALAINPNDTELMGEYGYRLAVSGDWDTGCKLVAEARKRNPGPLAYYESALALCAYFRGDNEQAVMWIRKTSAPKSALYHLIAAVVFSGAGDVAQARLEHAWLAENEPALAGNVRQEVSVRLGRALDVERVMATLRKAGFEPGS